MITTLEIVGMVATLSLFVFLLIPQVVTFFRRLYSKINPITLNIHRRLYLSLLNGLILTVPSLLFVLDDVDDGQRVVKAFFAKYIPVLVYISVPIILAWLRPIPAYPLDVWDVLIVLAIFIPVLLDALITNVDILFGAHIYSKNLWADFNSLYILAGNLCMLVYAVLRPLPDTGFGRELRLPTLWDLGLILLGLLMVSLLCPLLLTTSMVEHHDVTLSVPSLFLNLLLILVFLALPLELFFRGAIQNLFHARVEVYYDVKKYSSDTPLEAFSLNGDSIDDLPTSQNAPFYQSEQQQQGAKSPKPYRVLSTELNEPLNQDMSKTLFDTQLTGIHIYGDGDSSHSPTTTPSIPPARDWGSIDQKGDDLTLSDVVPLPYKPPHGIPSNNHSPVLYPIDTTQNAAINMSNLAKSSSFVSSVKYSTLGSARDVQDSTCEMLGEGQVSFQTSKKIRVLQSELESPSWPTWSERNSKAFQGPCTHWWQFPMKLDYACLLIGSLIYAASLTYHITSIVQQNNSKDEPALWVPVFFTLLYQGLVSGYIWRMTSQVWCSAIVTGFFFFFGAYWIGLKSS